MEFIIGNFDSSFNFVLLWIFFVCILSVIYRKFFKRNKVPKQLEGPILFSQKNASGCSQKSFYTRLAGAKGTLKVSMNNNSILIAPIISLMFISEISDLEHLIDKKNIIDVSEAGDRIIIKFNNYKDKQCEFILSLSDKNEFLSVFSYFNF